MRLSSRRNGRFLRIETLETRALMSAVPSNINGAAIFQNATINAAGDMVIPIHAQVGSTALETILGVAAKLDSLEQVVNAYLNSVPGWHLTGGIDTTPSYCGKIDGSVVIGANGLLKSANVALSGSADIGGAIEGYYGVSVLHVGVGAAADLSANINAAASFSVDTNTWYFGGSAAMVGSVKGYASAMAWPVKGEVYVKGDATASASLASDTGLASASVSLVGSVGADAQLKSLFGGWTTIASVSRNFASWKYSATFDVGSWLKSEVGGVVATNQATRATAVTASAALAKASAADVSTSALSAQSGVGQAAQVESHAVASAADASVSTFDVSASLRSGGTSLLSSKSAAKPEASSASVVASLHASALQQLDVANLLLDRYCA